MKIEHKAEMVKDFAERILGYHYKTTTEGRKGWHRSDAIACPLKAYWRITEELKGEFRSRDVGILMIGTMAHQVLEQGFDAKEKVFDVAGVKVTVDALAGEYPVEVKTTRKKVYRSGDIPRDWVEQLAIAMSVMGIDKGYLMIINIITFSLTVWEFTMNEDERELTKQAFIWQILNIADAIEKHKPEQLKPRYSDCMWCYYRPSKNSSGCPFYQKPKEDESGY
jgi:CRISPR/Cas system-associated exonuclease Cas4 (RecB family)